MSKHLPIGPVRPRRLAQAQWWRPSEKPPTVWCGVPFRLSKGRLGGFHRGYLRCIIDPRCLRMPLQCVPVGQQAPTANKLLCVAWLGKEDLVVGGSDGLDTQDGTYRFRYT